MIATTDPIADMLSRIRNAIMVQKSTISAPYSKIKHSIALLLAENNFIQAVEIKGESIEKTLIITINKENANANITKLTRISKPGRRHYVNVANIPKVKNGRGITIISTSQGLMTGDQAKAKRLGGELICEVY